MREHLSCSALTRNQTAFAGSFTFEVTMNEITTRKNHRTALLLHVAAVLILTTIPSLAATQAQCSLAGEEKPDWVVVGGTKTADDTVCVKPGVEWGKYQFQIEPSSFALTDERQLLKEEDARKLTAFFDAELQSSFRNQTLQDGPVLRIKPTITGVRRSKSAVNAISLVSIKVPLSYGGAAVRFDLIDDTTGEIVGIVNSGGRGRAWNGFQGLRALGHSRSVLKGSAKRIRRDTEVLRKGTEAD